MYTDIIKINIIFNSRTTFGKGINAKNDIIIS